MQQVMQLFVTALPDDLQLERGEGLLQCIQLVRAERLLGLGGKSTSFSLAMCRSRNAA